jgi:hypothetical protein
VISAPTAKTDGEGTGTGREDTDGASLAGFRFFPLFFISSEQREGTAGIDDGCRLRKTSEMIDATVKVLL